MAKSSYLSARNVVQNLLQRRTGEEAKIMSKSSYSSSRALWSAVCVVLHQTPHTETFLTSEKWS